MSCDNIILGGNAVIGVDIDYTEFSGNKTGVVINGTIVKLTPIMNHQLNQTNVNDNLETIDKNGNMIKDISLINDTEYDSTENLDDYTEQIKERREQKLIYWEKNPEELIQLQRNFKEWEEEMLTIQNEKMKIPERLDMRKIEKEVFDLTEELGKISFIKKSEKEVINNKINSKLMEISRIESVIQSKETAFNTRINELQRRINEIDLEINPR